MKRILPLLALALLVSGVTWADPLEPFGFVKQVTQNDGDTITTTQINCSCSSGCVGGPTVLSASQTVGPTGSKTNRHRRFVNTSPFEVFIGTAAVAYALNTTGYRLDAASGTYHVFDTYNTAAFSCQSVGGSSGTVSVIQETNAAP